jgi:hypothetical protein
MGCIDALSNDGVVVPGQDVRLSLIAANNGAAEVAIRQAKFSGFTGDGTCALNQVTTRRALAWRTWRPIAPPPVRCRRSRKTSRRST